VGCEIFAKKKKTHNGGKKMGALRKKRNVKRGRWSGENTVVPYLEMLISTNGTVKEKNETDEGGGI